MNPTPSLAELIFRAKGNMEKELGVKNPAINAIASAIAGVSFGQYAHQDYLFKQLSPETADEKWLDLWAVRFNVPRLTTVFAVGYITFTQPGVIVTVPENVIVNTGDGVEYKTTKATDSNLPVPVQAVKEGNGSNIIAGTSLYLITAVAGLAPEKIHSNDISGGAEKEELEHWRKRIVKAFSDKQAIGRLTDYLFWAKSSHPDIDYAWGFDNTPSLGMVSVYIGTSKANPIVSMGVRATCQAFIETVRLAGCHVTISLPITKSVNIIIKDVPDSTIRANIKSALDSFFITRMDRRDPLMVSELSAVIWSITNSFTLVGPIGTTTIANNEILTMGTMTWQ